VTVAWKHSTFLCECITKLEALGEGYRASPKNSDKCDPKPVWVHAWKVNHGGDFLNTTIDGEIQGAEEGLAHGLY